MYKALLQLVVLCGNIQQLPEIEYSNTSPIKRLL